MKFGDNLRNLRKMKKISQEELSMKVGVSRQSVSKWETGEAYPEMNNILMLCKIFNCNINDLVNDNIIDLDSLDEDIKMSVVKFKKEKQRKIKGISKAIEIIAKIGGILTKIGVVCIILSMIFMPFIVRDVDVKNGSLVVVNSNSKIKIVDIGNKTAISLEDIKILDENSKETIEKVKDVFENNSKARIIAVTETGLAILLTYLVLLIIILKQLEKLFKNINERETPFTLENVNYIKKMTYLMIVVIILSGIGSGIFDLLLTKTFSLQLEGFNIIEILFLYSMSLIFEYGYEIQLDSNGKMYGEEE